MKIIKASYIIDCPEPPIEMLRRIERAGRVCYKSEDRITDISCISMIRSLISAGHESVLEHGIISDKFLLELIEQHYMKKLHMGLTPQQARYFLPNGLKTEIVMTCNLREWRHVLKLRTSAKAHPQMRELMVPLLQDFKDLIPIVFDDIESRQYL